jgi:hypothetical protein
LKIIRPGRDSEPPIRACPANAGAVSLSARFDFTYTFKVSYDLPPGGRKVKSVERR